MKEVVVYIRSMVFLGTQIVAFPLLYQIKQFWPDCHLRVVGQDDLAQYYESLPWVDDYVRANRLKQNFLALNKPDLVIALHFASEQFSLVSLLKGVKTRIGFRNGRVTDVFWTHRYKKDYSEYMGVANLKLLAAYRSFDIATAARACVTAIAAQRTSNPDLADVVFMPGGGAGDYKRWPVERYVELADLLGPRMGADIKFCFVLGPDEQREYQWLQSLNRDDFVLFANRPLSELAWLTLQAKLIVANDCGPCHYGQFAGVPYVGVFHETNLEWFWRRSDTASVVPMFANKDIKSIEASDVFEAAIKVMR
ncbi:ADP-heptose:LPS heptosyltransferase [Jezberella montanilacus]|uniref:ADP-heptose:LPS heptosyltransferase n=1 Tax=Jezberella montanilacus TaxID=323426 RepID=A0A2T0XKF6_9BURK|nr:glycosyltransferase family 9 protein [Jezberella montanilacus]PRY99439.1 ADP-heptose:LPS heptosyltransferase [Jezberella montanilacus]